MYAIVAKDQLPLQDILPLKIITHKKLTGDAIKLIAYLYREAIHNKDAPFIANYFYASTGITRSGLKESKALLLNLGVYSEYTDRETGVRVHELDYTALLEVTSTNPLNVMPINSNPEIRLAKQQKAEGKKPRSFIALAESLRTLKPPEE